ncbi:prion-inhibition and propagation-domain-containing protein [Xylaria telfairii]|nr:prion-inhibition and propagation-domain-containing protein [Xylaria telfairii]
MDAAAAALQFFSIAVQAFHGCVLAIELFNTAQNMGADGDLFHTGLEFEKYRLMAWASRVGLLDDNGNQTINWPLASILLGQLKSLLTSADVLQNRYYLNVTEEEVQAMEVSQASKVPRAGVANLIARLKPNLHTTTSKIIHEHNSVAKRLQWAARDKNKLKAFLRDIAGLINKLEFLLDSTERQQEKEGYHRLLREVVSLTTTTVEAGQMKDLLEDRSDRRAGEKTINAAAYLKQVRLVLGADKREDEVTPKPVGNVVGVKMPKLAVLGRSLKPWNVSELYTSSLEFATYRKQQVLVQWKVVETSQWERYTNQMKCLAVFLMSLSDESFRSLPCLGYYPLEAQGKHGVVYGMPDDEEDWDFKSLKSLISTESSVSLKRRLELARAIADTVLQLHTAGWLHKSLRSENIIFLAPRGSNGHVFLKAEPYIIGYEYARSDTKDSANAFTELPDTELETDLYRHPQARGPSRETFQKRFDMYAMACIFVEIVMWEPLVDIFSFYTTQGLRDIISIAQASNEIIKLPSLETLLQNDDAARMLAYRSGETVLEVIKTCSLAEKAKEGEEGLLEDQIAAVNKLAWCRI